MSTGHDVPPAVDRADFLIRIRAVAVVTLGYGLVQLAHHANFMFGAGVWWRSASSAEAYVDVAMQLSNLALALLMVVAAAALVRWQSWSRRALIPWAVLAVVLGLCSAIDGILGYGRYLRVTTQSDNPPLWRAASSHLFWWLRFSAYPVLVFLILRQEDVARLFSRAATGGFEVVLPRRCQRQPMMPRARAAAKLLTR